MNAGVFSRGSPMLKLMGVTPAGTSSRRLRSSVTNGYSPAWSSELIGPGTATLEPGCGTLMFRSSGGVPGPPGRAGSRAPSHRRRARPPGSRGTPRQELHEPRVRRLQVRDRAVLRRLVTQLGNAGAEVERRDPRRGEARHVRPSLLARERQPEPLRELPDERRI